MKKLILPLLLILLLPTLSHSWEEGAFGTVRDYLGRVNTTIKPSRDDYYDLGGPLRYWKNIYSSGEASLGTVFASHGDVIPPIDNLYTIGTSLLRWGDGQFTEINITGSADETQFTITENSAQTENIFVVKKSDGTHLFDIESSGEVDIIHTADESDDRTLEIDTNAAGFGDVKAIDIVYVTGDIETGEDEGIILVNIDESDAEGGDIAALEVLTTLAGSATVKIFGLEVGIGVAPVEQLSGTFGNMAKAENDGVNALTAFTTSDPGGANNVEIFVANNDTVLIGNTAKFEEIEFIFETFSIPSIKPTFEYSTGGTGFSPFTPTDGTNGMRNNGVVLWLDSDIPSWATNTGDNYEIRITRTRGNLNTTPKEDLIQIGTAVEYAWDKDGNVDIATLDVNDGAITNVSDIALDTISSDGASIVLGTGDENTYTQTGGTTHAFTLGSDAGDDFIVDGTGFVYEGDSNEIGQGTASPSTWYEQSVVDPELKLTDTGDSNNTRWVRSDTDAKAQMFNTVAISGAALDFKGGNDQVDLQTDVANLKITGNLTIATWFKFSTSQSNTVMVAKWGSDHAYLFWIPTAPSNRIAFTIRVSNVSKAATSTGTYNDGAWHAAIGRWNGTNVLLDIYDANGVSEESITGDATSGPIDDVIDVVKFGVYGGGTTGDYFGSLDEIAIWDKSIADTDADDYATGLYLDKDNNFPTSATSIGTNLQGLWHLDEGSGTNAADSSDNGYDGTLENMTDVDWVGGKVTPPTDTEALVWSSEDGVGVAEEGLQTFGDIAGGTILQGKRIEVDTNSNTTGLRIRGADSPTEITDMFVAATGNFVIDNTVGTDSTAYIDLRPEDNQFGLVLRESDGTAITAAYANFYVVDGSPDTLRINVTSAQDTDALVITSGNDVSIGDATPDSKFEILSSTDPQFRISHTDGVDDLTIGVDSDGKATLIASGGDIDTTGTFQADSYKSGDGSVGITQTETGVTNFDITIKDGLITAFVKN